MEQQRENYSEEDRIEAEGSDDTDHLRDCHSVDASCSDVGTWNGDDRKRSSLTAVMECYCFSCGRVLARSSSAVPPKDFRAWVEKTRRESGGCSKCGKSANDPRFVVRGRIVTI